MMNRAVSFGAIGAICLAFLSTSFAIAQQADDTALKIQDRDGKTVAEYTVEDLRTKFPVVDLETATPWTSGDQQHAYHGVAIADLMRAHDFQSIQLRAVDGFRSAIPASDIAKFNPILAYSRDCEPQDVTGGICKSDQQELPLGIEDKGPIFTVWPYAKLPDNYKPARNHLWVWFVDAMRQE